MEQYVSGFKQFLNEAYSKNKKPVIKKYVPRYAPTRNAVLSYLYEKGSVTQEEFYEYLFSIKESTGLSVTKSWLSKNKKFFKRKKINGIVHFSLNSFARKIVEKLRIMNEEHSPDDHMEIDLNPEEEVELRLGDMEVEISQKDDEEDADSENDKPVRDKVKKKSGNELGKIKATKVLKHDADNDDEEEPDFNDPKTYGVTDDK